MNCQQIGDLIKNRRIEKKLTQKQLAESMNISDKTISKWERGMGCPDVSLLPELAKQLNINIEELLKGKLEMNDLLNGNMKNTKFYVCPNCGNIITSSTETTLSCCGYKLEALEPKKADENHKLHVETIEDEWYITTDHVMTKSHYIGFIAFVTGERVLLIKQYPEWGIHLRLSKFGHGYLYNYCTKDGLNYQLL